jgi:pimeloyl-ACP methyl ester carboxylesterase
MLRREAAAVIQVPRLAAKSFSLRRGPRGDATVVLFPGFGTGDAIMHPMRRYLQGLGHDAHGWNLGTNRGDVNGQVEAAFAQVRRHHGRTGQQISLVGWSLGGVFAREIARDEPDMVDRVITFGTPIVGGPRYTRSAQSYEPQQLDQIETQVDERNLVPIVNRITAMYSKADGVVDWRACIDEINPTVENIEVKSTHAGMIIDPDVWSIIAQRLAA